MVDSAEATRDNAVPPDAAASALTGWREEVRSFLERTLQEIQQAVAELQPRSHARTPPRSPAASPTPTAPARTAAVGRESIDGQMDASQTRLENLKRRLSERLRTSSTMTRARITRRPPESQS